MSLSYGAAQAQSNVRTGLFGTGGTGTNNGQREDRPKARKWLNLGMTLPVEQADGTIAPTFITLIGVPFDDFELPRPGNSKNPAWNAMVNGKIELGKVVMALFDSMEAGSESELPGFEIQARFTADPADASAPSPERDAVASLIQQRIAAAMGRTPAAAN